MVVVSHRARNKILRHLPVEDFVERNFIYFFFFQKKVIKENSINNVDFINVEILVSIKSKLDYLYLIRYYQNKLEDDPPRGKYLIFPIIKLLVLITKKIATVIINDY